MTYILSHRASGLKAVIVGRAASIVVLGESPVHLGCKRDRARGRTGDRSEEVFPIESPQRAVVLRLDRRRSWDVSQQCDLTEEIAGTERHESCPRLRHDDLPDSIK